MVVGWNMVDSTAFGGAVQRGNVRYGIFVGFKRGGCGEDRPVIRAANDF